jgi:hypothetical protein
MYEYNSPIACKLESNTRCFTQISRTLNILRSITISSFLKYNFNKIGQIEKYSKLW